MISTAKLFSKEEFHEDEQEATLQQLKVNKEARTLSKFFVLAGNKSLNSVAFFSS